MTIVFIHGLNTYADGLVHVGPLTFGPMKTHWEKALRAQGFDFHAVRGIGFGPIEDQATRAEADLDAAGLLDGRDLILLGHSMGSLVARALVMRERVRPQVRKIFSVGSPHGGAHVAHLALDFDKHSPLLDRLFKTFGYDVGAKRGAFSNFTHDVIDEFNSRHPAPSGVRCVSFLCEVSGSHIGWALVMVHVNLRRLRPTSKSDGFIFSESQSWCETVGPFGLDHFAQMGVYFHLTPHNRRRARREFQRLIEAVALFARD